MDLDLTEEQRLIRDTAREFAAREIAPKAAEIDKSGRWPTEIVKQMADLGFLGMAVPEEFGGGGLDTMSYAIAMEEISAACASSGVIMSVNNSLFCDPVYKFGTDEQKRDLLAPTAAGKMLGAFGLTEPASGSDARTMKTVAERQGVRRCRERRGRRRKPGRSREAAKAGSLLPASGSPGARPTRRAA